MSDSAMPPEHELDHLSDEILREARMLDVAHVRQRYIATGLAVEPDPFSDAVFGRIREALIRRAPLSMIRISDGEGNFIAYGQHPETPELDRIVLHQSIMMFHDRFHADDRTMHWLRAQVEAAIAAADIVGVLGLWAPEEIEPADYAAHLAMFLHARPRGVAGQWRAIRHMLEKAETGALAGKTICSAHIYFGLVRRLSDLVAAADRVLCITNCSGAVARLRARHPDRRIDHVHLRDTKVPEAEMTADPAFLDATRQSLPDDLAGTLVLVGAGTWAELYCTWARQRGGVALDIGSGFDVLDGRALRPIHKQYFRLHGISPDDFTASG